MTTHMNRKDSVNNQEDAKHHHSDEFQGVIVAVVLVISQKTAITETDAKVRAITQLILQLTAIIQMEAKDTARDWNQGNCHT